MEPTEPKLSPETADPIPDTMVDASSTSSLESSQNSLEEVPLADPGSAPTAPARKPSFLSRLLKRFNIYLLLFLALLGVAAAIVVIVIITNRHSNNTSIQTQSLTASTLKQLAASDVTVGQPKQVLNVQSNAVFAGKVLIRDSLEVAGAIQVGGNMNIPGITVSGNSIFDAVQINKTLSVAGDSALQGQLAVQKNLSVAGNATFGGILSAPQLTTNSLQLNGDLNLTHHITAGGVTPGRSNGTALGSGGVASVSGSDTAGSVNISTGGSAAAGCFITINFTQKYNATPHVLITPVGSAAAGVGYYVNRDTSGFSICATNTPPSSTSFGFDYFVLD